MTHQVSFLFDLGLKVRDRLTGFQGTIAIREQHLNGCIRYRIQPYGLDKDGNPFKSISIDEGQVEPISEKADMSVGQSKGFIDYE